MYVKVRNYSNFTMTFPTIWRCAGDFFKVLLKFKMAATDQLFFWGGGRKNFNITFLATLVCASDFLKMLPKFKMGAKNEKLMSVIIHIVQSHYPPSGNVHVILLKFSMATTNPPQSPPPPHTHRKYFEPIMALNKSTLVLIIFISILT